MSKIVIIGSISMDLVMETDRIPQEGETVFGTNFSNVPGGKGANQAVAVGRLSGGDDQVIMLGNVGEDSFGRVLVDNLTTNGILSDKVGTVPQSTGTAQITIYNKDNRIIYYPGANSTVHPNEWGESEWQHLQEADLVILQNEIPHESNLAIARFCHKQGTAVLYNPAPARETDLEMIPYVSFFTPNESECKVLFPENSLEEVLERFPNKLIVTLGSRGSTFYDGKERHNIPAIKTEVIDTTGAGDTFNGAFGFAYSKGLEIKEALTFATVASHLSVQKFGAQGGMPTLDEIKENSHYEKAWNFK